MRRKRNPFISEHTFEDFIAQERARDPGFGAAFDAAEARLDLAQRLRDARKRKKLTQEQLARKAGTRQPNIARLESGRVLPHLDQIARIAEALGMRLVLSLVER